MTQVVTNHSQAMAAMAASIWLLVMPPGCMQTQEMEWLC